MFYLIKLIDLFLGFTLDVGNGCHSFQFEIGAVLGDIPAANMLIGNNFSK